MSDVFLLGSFIDIWAKGAQPYRNILFVGEVDVRELSNFVKTLKNDDITLISGSSLIKSGHVANALNGMEDDQLLIISGLQNIPDVALETFSVLFTDRQIQLELFDPPRNIAVDLPNFFLICTIDAGIPISQPLFEKFEIKILIGADSQISIYNSKQMEDFNEDVDAAIQRIGDQSIDLLIVSYEKPIILKIQSYLNDISESYGSCSYSPADEPGGTYALFVDGGTHALAMDIYERFKSKGSFAVEHDGRALFGGI